MRNAPLLLLSVSFGIIACVGQAPCEQGVDDDCSDSADETSLDKGSTQKEPSSVKAANLPSDNMGYGNLFQGGEASFYVHSGLEEDDFAGHWFITNDNEIGGNSSVSFPVPLHSPDNYDENISYCGGFCDTVKVMGNISTPYAGIGFNLVNKEAKGADITAWGGIVIDYVATHHPLTVALIPEGVTDIRQFYHYDLPAVPGHRAIRWSEFAQVDEGQHKRNKEDDLKHIAAMQFVVGGRSGDVTFIKIISLGTYYLRSGETPHEYTPASSSFYMEPTSATSSETSSAADSISTASAVSSESTGVLSSSGVFSSGDFSPSSSSTDVTGWTSSGTSSNTEISYSSSEPFVQSSSSIYFDPSSDSIGGQTNPQSSSNTSLDSSGSVTASSSSANDAVQSSSSTMQQWPGFGGDGNWGGWGGF